MFDWTIMTLFFNLENLEAEASGNDIKLVRLLYNLRTRRLPKSSRGYPRRNLVGNSFLLKPDPLFTKHNIDVIYVVQYIKLAGRRDYFLYKQYGIKSLNLTYFPDINLEAIKTNPLLKINNTEISFKYEEGN